MSFLRPAFLSILLAANAVAVNAVAAEPYSQDSPEHQALTAASPVLGDEEFTLREEYWKGTLTTKTGRATKLQFFKRNTYGLFFGVSPSALPKGAKLNLHILNAENEEVAHIASEPGEAAVAFLFENKMKSGIYLIVMGVEVPRGPVTETDVPAVLFYGWK